MEPVRRFRARTVLAVLIAVVVVAAVVAGLTRARTQSTAVGSGVVVIETNLGYQGGQAAGTGMVLTSSGEILTNNHVIRGATDIKVVVPNTGQSYTAQVVGYDVSHDVALLRDERRLESEDRLPGGLRECQRRPVGAGGRKRRWHRQAHASPPAP